MRQRGSMSRAMRARLIATVIAIVGTMGLLSHRDVDEIIITIMIMTIVTAMGTTRGRAGGRGARMRMRRYPSLEMAGRNRGAECWV